MIPLKPELKLCLSAKERRTASRSWLSRRGLDHGPFHSDAPAHVQAVRVAESVQARGARPFTYTGRHTLNRSAEFDVLRAQLRCTRPTHSSGACDGHIELHGQDQDDRSARAVWRRCGASCTHGGGRLGDVPEGHDGLRPLTNQNMEREDRRASPSCECDLY